MSSKTNILKVRDDHQPLYFQPFENQKFKLINGPLSYEWFTGDSFSVQDLRGRIEPWLSSLFQSEHLSLLVGSGLSTAIQILANRKLGTDNTNQEIESEVEEDGNSSSADSSLNGMGIPDLADCPYSDKIKRSVEKGAARLNRGKGNFEDYLRVINDLLQGLEIIGDNQNYEKLKKYKTKMLENFAKNISAIENDIAVANDESKTIAFNNLVMFLMSFASRTGTRDRIHIFTTNYDRVIEAGAEIAGLHLIDRFVGNLSPIFRSSRLNIDMHYNPPGIRGEPRYLEGVARFTKLHGSIDWIMSGKSIRKIGLPFGARYIDPYLQAPGLDVDCSNIMIYPNSSKDRETAEYPYVELFRDFAAALCRPNSTLVTYGYSFGDEHINRVIRDMLTIPSTHLIIISYDDVLGRIDKIYKEIGRPSQISLMIGPDLADIEMLTSYFLPKPSIDRASIRMNELLKQRYSNQESSNTQQTTTESLHETIPINADSESVSLDGGQEEE